LKDPLGEEATVLTAQNALNDSAKNETRKKLAQLKTRREGELGKGKKCLQEDQMERVLPAGEKREIVM